MQCGSSSNDFAGEVFRDLLIAGLEAPLGTAFPVAARPWAHTNNTKHDDSIPGATRLSRTTEVRLMATTII